MARRRQHGLAAFFEDFSLTGLMFHPATLFVFFNVALAATAVWCWNRYQDKIVDPQLSVLSAEKIEINTPPAWAKTDLKAAIMASQGEPKSLLDPLLISDAVATCQSIGWVEQVRSMEKTRQGLKVDLVYREPVAIVELHAKTVPGWTEKEKLVPVDRNGVIMPQTLALKSAAQPRIFIYHSDSGQQRAPQHLRHIYRWTQWPDARVADAAAISDVLANNWQAFGLSRVISWRLFGQQNDRTIPYELWTGKGENAATVIWGNSPGSELENEADWEQKSVALEAYVQQHGRLDKLSERIIDLRSGQAIEVGRASGLGYRNAFDIR